MPEGYQTTQPRVRGWSGSLPRCLRTNPRAPIVPWRGSTVMNRFSLIELRGDQVGPRCACLLTGSRDTQNTTGTSGVKQTRPGTFVNQAALPGASLPDRGHAWARALASRQRTPSGGWTIPRKQNTRKRTCGCLRSLLAARRLGRYAAASTFQRARIIAHESCGTMMPQDAPGAVGEHGCRRRAE